MLHCADSFWKTAPDHRLSAARLSQTQDWTPIGGQYCAPFDSDRCRTGRHALLRRSGNRAITGAAAKPEFSVRDAARRSDSPCRRGLTPLLGEIPARSNRDAVRRSPSRRVWAGQHPNSSSPRPCSPRNEDRRPRQRQSLKAGHDTPTRPDRGDGRGSSAPGAGKLKHTIRIDGLRDGLEAHCDEARV